MSRGLKHGCKARSRVDGVGTAHGLVIELGYDLKSRALREGLDSLALTFVAVLVGTCERSGRMGPLSNRLEIEVPEIKKSNGTRRQREGQEACWQRCGPRGLKARGEDAELPKGKPRARRRLWSDLKWGQSGWCQDRPDHFMECATRINRREVASWF